jgi:hypothetical protein
MSALCQSSCSRESLLSRSLNVGEDGKQTFEASMMTADNRQAFDQLWPYRDVHRLLSMLMQRGSG